MIGERKRNETYEGRRGCGLNTRVVRVDKDNPDKTVLQEVGEVIKKGRSGCVSHGNRVRSGR